MKDETAKILAADLVIVQTPVWAMYAPWQMKRWIDFVTTDPAVCGTDGRSRENPGKKDGTGGFLTDKHYMLSTTWNAPAKALFEPNEFYDGRGLEGALLPLHKQFEYLGMAPIASFAVHDVYKNPTIAEDLKRWRARTAEVAVELGASPPQSKLFRLFESAYLNRLFCFETARRIRHESRLTAPCFPFISPSSFRSFCP